MAWINTDYTFDDHRAVFYITHQEMAMGKSLHPAIPFEGMARRFESDSEFVANCAMGLIGYYRPELAGCVLYYLSFDVNWQRWLFGVTHGSLPAVKMGEKAVERPLNPAQEAELVA